MMNSHRHPKAYSRIYVIAFSLLTLALFQMAPAMSWSTEPLNEFIGIAEMEADGTIILRLNAQSDDNRGIKGQGYFRYSVNSPQYKNILEHVGPLKPGESKPVSPWPETSRTEK